MIKTGFLFAFLLVLAACSTHQKVSFNKDWSGKVVTTLDFTTLMALSGLDSEGDSTTVFQDSLNVFKIESLKQIKGIKNVKVEKNTTKISVLSYEFEDVDAVNASAYLMAQDMLSDPLHSFF